MPYKDRVTFKGLSDRVESFSTQLIDSIQGGENRYQKFLRLKGAATNAQIATKLTNAGETVSTADIDALEVTLESFHQVYLFFTNTVATTGDHMANCRDFSA